MTETLSDYEELIQILSDQYSEVLNVFFAQSKDEYNRMINQCCYESKTIINNDKMNS